MGVETRIHPETGKLLRRGVRPMTVRYKGLERTVMQPGWWPDDDSDGLISGLDAKETDHVLHEMKAEIANLPSPDDVRRIRQRLKLSQRRAGEVLGGGPRAFQKYESGEVAVSRPMANLLRLLEHEPARLKELLTDRAA